MLLAGLFVLLDAVVHEGAVAWALTGLHDAARGGPLGTLLAAAFGSAVAANLFNNLPIAGMSAVLSSRTPDRIASLSVHRGNRSRSQHVHDWVVRNDSLALDRPPARSGGESVRIPAARIVRRPGRVGRHVSRLWIVK